MTPSPAAVGTQRRLEESCVAGLLWLFGGIEVYIGGGCAGEPATGKGIVSSGRF